MDFASIVANRVIIMIILIGIGIIISKKGILTIEATKVYSNFLLVIVMPALIINSYQRDMVKEQLIGLGFSFLLAVVFHIISIIISNLVIRKREGTNYKVERMGAVYSNCGFMGFPILFALIGDVGVLYGTAFLAVFNIFSWTHGVINLSDKESINIKKAFLNPGVIAVIVGLFLFLTQIKLGGILSETISYVADLNTPLSMIITGVFLANVNIKDTLKDVNVHKVVLLRNILVPLIMLIILKVIGFGNWFQGADNVALAHIIACACPTAIVTILFPARMGLDGEHGAKLIVLSTVASIITMPIFAYILTM